MHPLVRDLYKRALMVGQDYPLGMEYVRRTWKKALRNPENCPSCYENRRGEGGGGRITTIPNDLSSPQCERELRKAVARGRYMVREMIGVIQLKKYRAMKKRYDDQDDSAQKADYVDLLAKKYLEKNSNP